MHWIASNILVVSHFEYFPFVFIIVKMADFFYGSISNIKLTRMALEINGNICPTMVV